MDTIQSVQTKDFIANELKKEIFSGRFQSGEEITQEGVAQVLGVSRMPVREAFQLLAQQGFLKRLPNRHVQVVSMDKRQIMETFRMVSALETELLSMLTSDDVKRLVAQGESILASNIPDADFFRGELAFHRSAVQMIDNAYLEQIADKLLSGYISYAILNLKHSRQESARRLAGIIRSLDSRDGQELRAHMDAYYMELAGCFLESKEGQG